MDEDQPPYHDQVINKRTGTVFFTGTPDEVVSYLGTVSWQQERRKRFAVQRGIDNAVVSLDEYVFNYERKQQIAYISTEIPEQRNAGPDEETLKRLAVHRHILDALSTGPRTYVEILKAAEVLTDVVIKTLE